MTLNFVWKNSIMWGLSSHTSILLTWKVDYYNNKDKTQNFCLCSPLSNRAVQNHPRGISTLWTTWQFHFGVSWRFHRTEDSAVWQVWLEYISCIACTFRIWNQINFHLCYVNVKKFIPWMCFPRCTERWKWHFK